MGGGQFAGEHSHGVEDRLVLRAPERPTVREHRERRDEGRAGVLAHLVVRPVDEQRQVMSGALDLCGVLEHLLRAHRISLVCHAGTVPLRITGHLFARRAVRRGARRIRASSPVLATTIPTRIALLCLVLRTMAKSIRGARATRGRLFAPNLPQARAGPTAHSLRPASRTFASASVTWRSPTFIALMCRYASGGSERCDSTQARNSCSLCI